MITRNTFGGTCLAGGPTSVHGSAGNAIAMDSSGNGYHGIHTGTVLLHQPGLVPLDSDTCVKYDTDDDMTYIGTPAALSFANIFTMEFWYKPTLSDSHEGVISKAGSGYEYAVVRTGSNLDFAAFSIAGAAVYSTSIAIADLTAHHYVWSCDGANARLYKDSVLQTTVAKTGASMGTTSSPLRFGVTGGVELGAFQKSSAEFIACQMLESASVQIVGSTVKTGADTIKAGLTEVSSLFITGRIDKATADTIVGSIVEFSVVTPDSFFLINRVGADTIAIQVVEPQDVETQIDTNDTLTVVLVDSGAISISDLSGARPALGLSKTRMGPHMIPTRRHP